ncbi:hypothetical protein ACLKA7_008965 [Drosophila subpalustris]
MSSLVNECLIKLSNLVLDEHQVQSTSKSDSSLVSKSTSDRMDSYLANDFEEVQSAPESDLSTIHHKWQDPCSFSLI